MKIKINKKKQEKGMKKEAIYFFIFWQPSATDMLPSPANLVRWNISNDSKCKCGKLCT